MTSADQLAIVNRKLEDGDKAAVLADCGLVQDWLKSKRILAVVRDGSKSQSQSAALFVYQSNRSPIMNTKDLVLDAVLPVDADFAAEIDHSQKSVLLNVSSSNGKKMLFEMLSGLPTEKFVSEVYEVINKRPKIGLEDFSWLVKYTKALKNDEDLNMADVGESLPEPSDSSPIAARESVVKYQMLMKEDQFTEVQPFTVLTATWNVNGQSPNQPLSPWLSVDEDPPDVYAVGFQELDLTKEAFIFNESMREEEWRKAVAASLHKKSRYHQVKLVRLVGMMLVVYVKEDHLSAVTNVDVDTVGTGIMGKLGNKGGVAVRMDFHNTSVCFVNSHLAAHVSEFERRNQDYQEIQARISFNNFNPPKMIKDHEMIFWIGDLNYRIDNLDCNQVKDCLANGRTEVLKQNDQLNNQKGQRRIFFGFREGEIGFVPTYRYDAGTDNWDTSEKCRAPAWTDRVLWKGERVEQLGYRSHPQLKTSDHKPVSALFRVGVKVVDGVKYRKIYEEVMKRLDKLENEFLPQATVSTTEINLGEVSFIEPASGRLTCANTGQVPVQFEFIRKPGDRSICKAWLTVEPSTGFIMPGETLDIKLEAFVGKKTAGDLTSGKDQLYDILVLHLVGGKDIFGTVSGSYKRSSFGSSIDALCRLTVPICEMTCGAVSKLENDEVDGGGDDAYPVPKELWFLCDLITKMGLDNEQVFLQPGLRSEIIAIRDWLDTGLPPDGPHGVSVHSVCETLLLFLESFRKPVIPFNLYGQCLESAPNYLLCKQIVSHLPAHHGHVFRYICSFLREVIRHSPQNGIDPKILAALFASIILRDPPGTNLGTGIRARTNQQLLEHKKVRFFYHFLVNDGGEES